MPRSTPHLVLVNLGTPAAPTPVAVRAFLDEFLSDPDVVDYPAWFWRPVLRGMVLRRRPARVAELYASIWSDDGSPLRVATERIAEVVRARAHGRFHVSTAYRYGEPSLETVMARIAREPGHGRVVVVPLFPQRTSSTTATAFTEARRAAGRAGILARLEARQLAPDDAGYVAALAARFEEAVEGAGGMPDHVVVSFHGIPVRYDRRERGQYARDCEATTRAFLAAIGWPSSRATLAYQSRFGPEPWLTPSLEGTLAALPARGVQRAAVIAPGFLTDGLETIEEIGIRGAETFHAAGGRQLVRVPAVEEHASFIATLAMLAHPAGVSLPAAAPSVTPFDPSEPACRP